jgi:hypothetical protein
MTSRYQGVSGSSYSNSSKRKQQLPWVVTTFSRDASSSIYPQLLLTSCDPQQAAPHTWERLCCLHMARPLPPPLLVVMAQPGYGQLA